MKFIRFRFRVDLHGLRGWEGWSWLLRLDPVLRGRVEGKDPVGEEFGHGAAKSLSLSLTIHDFGKDFTILGLYS